MLHMQREYPPRQSNFDKVPEACQLNLMQEERNGRDIRLMGPEGFYSLFRVTMADGRSVYVMAATHKNAERQAEYPKTNGAIHSEVVNFRLQGWGSKEL